MPRSTPWFILVTCLVGLLLARESHRPGPLSGIDRAFFDWLTANTSPVPPSSDLPSVTLVEIDQSLADAPGRLPLPPLDYALFLQAVEKYDPAVVAIEPVLDWSVDAGGQSQGEGEQILLSQALSIPKLLLGFRLGSAENGSARDATAIPSLNEVRGSRAALAEFPDVVAAPGARLLPVASSGATNLVQGRPDAVVRDLPLVFRCRERVLPSFTLQTLALGLQLAFSEISVEPGSHIQLGSRLRLPIDRSGRALLDARAFSRMRRISLDDLMLLNAGQSLPDTAQAVTVAARMHNGIVILGRTDASVRSLRVPGVESTVSPAEVFAWAAESLEESPPTHRASAWWDGAIIVGAALAGVGLLRRERGTAVILSIGAMAVYVLAALSAFEMFRIWLPCTVPFGLTLTTVILLWAMPRPESRREAASKTR